MNQRTVGYPSTSWASCIFRKSVLLFLCWFIIGIIRHTVSLSAQLPKVAKQVAEWSYWFEFLPLHVVSTVRRPTLSHYENIVTAIKSWSAAGTKLFAVLTLRASRCLSDRGWLVDHRWPHSNLQCRVRSLIWSQDGQLADDGGTAE